MVLFWIRMGRGLALLTRSYHGEKEIIKISYPEIRHLKCTLNTVNLAFIISADMFLV